MTEADREKVGWIRNGLVYAGAEDLCRIIRELEAERDAAHASAVRAHSSEQALRSELTAVYGKYGMAPGPEALDAVVRERDALRARCERLTKVLVNSSVPLEVLAQARAIGVGESVQYAIEEAVLDIRAALEEVSDVR